MNHFRFLLITSLFLLLAVAETGLSLNAQSSDTNPGSPAPALELEKLLQAPAAAKADWPSLKGNVVVLEFWATWCAPCIAAMPHLNELTEQFKDKPVKFISITDEDEATVTPFLRRRTIKGWVGLDLDRSVLDTYNVDRNGLPLTIVVDREGKIASVGRPSSLTAEKLNQILEGNIPIAAPDKAAEAAKLKLLNAARGEKEPANAEPPQLSVTIRPSKATTSMMGGGPGLFQASGVDLKSALSALYGINKFKIELPAKLQDARYDITARLKDDKTGAVKQIAARSLESALGINVQWVTREVDVYVLTAPGSLTGNLKPSTAKRMHATGADGVSAGVKASIKYLVAHIENVLKVPVVDETNLQGEYDWDLLHDARNTESIIEAVRKELSLELKRGRRAVEIITAHVN